MDPVTDTDVPADAVHDVLEHLFGSGALSKAHDRTANLVRADLHRFDHANLIAHVVIHEQGTTLLHAIKAHALLAMVQDFFAPSAFDRRLAGKGHLDGALFLIDNSARGVNDEVARENLAGLQLLGDIHAGLTLRRKTETDKANRFTSSRFSWCWHVLPLADDAPVLPASPR